MYRSEYGPRGCLVCRLEVVDVFAGRIVPLLPVAFVDAVHPALLGALNVLVRQEELTEGRVECEAVHAVPGRVHHHCARTVDEVSGGHLHVAGLETILNIAVVTRSNPPVNRENRTDADVHVDVRGAVERVEQQDIVAFRTASG